MEDERMDACAEVRVRGWMNKKEPWKVEREEAETNKMGLLRFDRLLSSDYIFKEKHLQKAP